MNLQPMAQYTNVQSQVWYHSAIQVLQFAITLSGVDVSRAVVVAQLVEQLLPTPEVHDSNPVIGKFYVYFLFSVLKSRK